jgi:hypothetical protein
LLQHIKHLITAIATISVAMLPFAACGGAEGPTLSSVSCALVGDSTSFARDTDVKQKIATNVPRFLRDCSSVNFSVITGVSRATDCRSSALRIEPTADDNPNGNPKVAETLRISRRKAALRTLENLVQCGLKEKPTQTGSDVLGALDLAARGSVAYGRVAHILVISDMAENTKSVDLYKADVSSRDKRGYLIGLLRERGELPDLRGMEISIIGFGTFAARDATRLLNIQAFWDELFAAAGTPSVSYL